jgi:GTP-binding protein YchF
MEKFPAEPGSLILKAGIIGFPMVGKSTLFKILTKATINPATYLRKKGESAVGIATVPDSRLDQLAVLFRPRKTTHAVVEYMDVPSIAKGAAAADFGLGHFRNVDLLVNVVRAFDDDLAPTAAGQGNPALEIAELDLELILRDLSVIEKRLERLEKDLKKMKNRDLIREDSLLRKCNQWLEQEKPLRSLELCGEEKKRLRGFAFLSEKPLLHVLNLTDSAASRLTRLAEAYRLEAIAGQPNVEVTGVCGKLEAEIAELPDEEAVAFLTDYGLSESGLVRLLRTTYRLLGLISFFTVSKEECRAWTIPSGTSALKAAGAVHSDMERCFIRAEVIPWNVLLEVKSPAAARQRGLLRLEGKEYVVQDGETIYFRHSA